MMFFSSFYSSFVVVVLPLALFSAFFGDVSAAVLTVWLGPPAEAFPGLVPGLSAGSCDRLGKLLRGGERLRPAFPSPQRIRGFCSLLSCPFSPPMTCSVQDGGPVSVTFFATASELPSPIFHSLLLAESDRLAYCFLFQ